MSKRKGITNIKKGYLKELNKLYKKYNKTKDESYLKQIEIIKQKLKR